MPLLDAAVGFLLGLSLAAPPGPVNALIAREASRGGAWAGTRAGLPAPVVDTAYLLLVLFGLARFVDLDAATPWLAGVGALLMAYLAWSTIRTRNTEVRSLAGPYQVWAVTLTNPFQYAWWVSAGAVFLTGYGAFGIAGFLVAIFGWVLLFSLLVAEGARRWKWFAPAVTWASAGLLGLFAVLLAWRAVTA